MKLWFVNVKLFFANLKLFSCDKIVFYECEIVVRECEIVVLSLGHVFKPAAFGLVPYCPMSCIES